MSPRHVKPYQVQKPFTEVFRAAFQVLMLSDTEKARILNQVISDVEVDLIRDLELVQGIDLANQVKHRYIVRRPCTDGAIHVYFHVDTPRRAIHLNTITKV
jgi:hypothetical protein